MLCSNGLTRSFRAIQAISRASRRTRRGLHYDSRNRLSNFWTPTQSKKPAETNTEDGHDLLVRAGYLRQAHSGVFHLLPLGLRVQDKIEGLIDKHMLRLGASKVALSSLTSEELWQRSGRLEKGRGNEFFRIEDRKGSKLLLSPTHEEEITTIVANSVHSHKQLPLRLYQVSRKYRDEARPRQGLLRGREFVMKDLYTFDATSKDAVATYENVRGAYRAFLDELRIPYLVADADSGNMGGNLSHEYHFASESGEDTIIKCTECGFTVNEELYVGHASNQANVSILTEGTARRYLTTKDRGTVIVALYPKDNHLNTYAIKDMLPDVDGSVDDAEAILTPSNAKLHTISFISDPRTTQAAEEILGSYQDSSAWKHVNIKEHKSGLLLTKARSGDACPKCLSASLTLHKAVEIGHTFHLGTRYSEPLNLRVMDAKNKQSLVHMGCHGIGVSRLIGAAASLLADKRGLNWPLAIAPFGVVLIAAGKTPTKDLDALYDSITQTGADAVIDDRTDYPTGWRLNDADLIGYPFIVVAGKAWAEKEMVELQCRRLSYKEEITMTDLAEKIAGLSKEL